MAEEKFPKENSGKKKAIRIVFFVVFIFLVSGASSILADKYVFPWFAAHEWFGKQPFFKKAMENVTVISKTEQVTVSEGRDISGFIGKSSSSVVEIVSSGKSQSASGIIVAADGLVASFDDNFFGVRDAGYKVFTQDGNSYGARVAEVDPFSNIALLKLDNAENLPVAEFIAPEDIKPGLKTVAIGRSGFNSEMTLRMGITSEWAKSFSLAGPVASSEKLQGVLFVDMDSGDGWDEALTGGAAVDQNGNVIGILGGRKERANARPFVVPVNHLRYVIDQYLANGKIGRGVLGVYYAALSKEKAYLAGNNFERGALIWSPSGQQGLAVIAGSAADASGIKIGDVILSVNGEEINPDQNLAYLISQHKPGDKVDLRISREGKEMNISAVLQQ